MKCIHALAAAMLLVTVATAAEPTAPRRNPVDKAVKTILTDTRGGTDAVTIPQMLTYQGKLLNAAGQPVADGSYSIVFSLYTDPTGPTSFWSETKSVTTEGGLFNVILGSGTAIAALPEAGTLYLGVKVGSDAEMTPRTRIVAVAYAYHADNAAEFDGHGFAELYGMFVDERQTDAISEAMIQNSAVTMQKLNQSGATTGQVIKWGGSAWIPAQDNAGGAPSGPAGGDLAGTYPSPAIAQKGAATGQLLKWNGSSWLPASDNLDNAWVRVGSDSVLYTIRPLGIARAGNTLCGNQAFTHVNLGTNSQTGTPGQDRMYATVGGGQDNGAWSEGATVSGGCASMATGDYSTVGGGNTNAAIGQYSTVPGGYGCQAGGRYSFASGCMAIANHTGSFVWADSGGSFASTARGQFLVRAKGGAEFWGNVTVRDTIGNVLLEFGQGLDYAEGFDVTNADQAAPGTVLSIDPLNVGRLRVSSQPYDSRVAGIVAGANDLGSGVKLGGSQFDHNVALAGRVYCNVDATADGVEPGDLLTTSGTPGHAMKAQDRARAAGAILGKALERLPMGSKGRILVLVSLQ